MNFSQGLQYIDGSIYEIDLMKQGIYDISGQDIYAFYNGENIETDTGRILESFYSRADNLGDKREIADKILGVSLISIAIFTLVVRFRLANFKKNGPKLFLINTLISGAISLLYLVVIILLFGTDTTLEIEFIKKVIVLILQMVLYSRYYEKRKHLFFM